MSIIKVENLTFSYPGSYDNIFENCSFQIDTDWKLGFVGRNGRGKTTLFKLLLQQYPYQGRIVSSVPFEYFPYEVSDKSIMTIDILHEIAPDAHDWEFIRELSYLDTDADVLWRSFETLSNGEQTKALLAAFFLNDLNFKLIDEPTNHLDIDSRKVLAKYLQKKNGYILISHDRAFLDICVDHILSLNKASIDVQVCNFSTYMDNFRKQQHFEETENIKLQRDISKLKKSAKAASAWSKQTEASKYGNGPVDRGFIGHKSAKMMKRSKTLEKRHNKAIEEKSKLLQNIEKTEELKIHCLYHNNPILASFSNVAVSFNQRNIFDPISFDIKQGARIAITGKNGCGKSSLLKILIGIKKNYTGALTVAPNLIISYVPQDASFLHGGLDDFANEHNLEQTLFKTILRKLDFSRIQFDKDMSEYSQGQKKKVLIAKSLCQKAHLYIWDEPLNFIDIYSRMQIENLIDTFCPTMIFVEHDVKFQQDIATESIELR